MAKQDDKRPVEKLKQLVDEIVEGIKQLLDPPQPIRIPVTAGGPRRR